MKRFAALLSLMVLAFGGACIKATHPVSRDAVKEEKALTSIPTFGAPVEAERSMA